MSKAFGQRLLNLLQKQGITQKELADRINTTEATLSRYVSGDREPKADMLANITLTVSQDDTYDENFDEVVFEIESVIEVRNGFLWYFISENTQFFLLKKISEFKMKEVRI